MPGCTFGYVGGHFGVYVCVFGMCLSMQMGILVPGHAFRLAGCSIGRLVRIMKFQNTSWSLMFLCSGF